MKIRIPLDLYRRAQACAADTGDPVGRWLWLCTRPKNIAAAENHAAALSSLWTHPGSPAVVATMDTVYEDHDTVRLHVARQVLRCEALRRPKDNTLLPEAADPAEGRDYLVEEPV